MLPLISITESALMTAIRTVLLSWLPSNVEVVNSIGNRVAEPGSQDFIAITPIYRERLATNTTTYSDGPVQTPPTTFSVRSDMQPTKFLVQLDVHGPNSPDNTQIVSTMWRSDACCDAFAAAGIDVAPLYCSDPRQFVFMDGEQQAEERWIFDLWLQSNIIITSGQQFAQEIVVGSKPVTP